MKRLKTIFTALAFILLSLQAMAQNELEGYLATGAENNPELKALFNEYLGELENITQAGTLPDPTLAFGFFIQPVETRVGAQRAKISIAQMFPWFGTLNAREKVAAEISKAKFEMFEEARSRLQYDIKSVWYSLYFTDRAIGITKESIVFLNTLKDLTLTKIESASSSSVDLYRLEIEILDMENRLLELTDRIKTQKREFSNLLNITDTGNIKIPKTLNINVPTIREPDMLDSVRLRNHQLLNIGFHEASYGYQQEVAKKMGKPNITVGIDYTFVEQSLNPDLSPGESGKDAFMLPTLGITIPIHRKKYNSMVQEASLMEEALSYRKANELNGLETLLSKTYDDYQDSRRRIVLNERQLELARRSLEILEWEYSSNNRDFEEILRMESEVLSNNLELERSRTDLATSIAFLDYLMGK